VKKKIMGVAREPSPWIEAQVGKLHLSVLLDSGSGRSLVSLRDYQNLNLGGQTENLEPTEVECADAAGQSLGIVGEVKVMVKIQGFSWKWAFLISKKLRGAPILGVDFMAKTQLVLDFSSNKCHFAFAPHVRVPLIMRMETSRCFQTRYNSRRFLEVRCGKLNPQQLRKLEDLIQQYPDVLTETLGLTHLLEYDIQVLDNTPVRLSPYRLAPPKMKFIRGHIQQLLKDGVIEPSCSRYSSPMFLVPKPGGEYRAVVDFRALNKRISIESVPLPDVHSAFHWFSKAKYFTTLDLNSAYHQIPLAESSRHLTAFCTDWNLFQYRRDRLVWLQGLKF
jgi:hypothetical protein